jgi:hypothetical protein
VGSPPRSADFVAPGHPGEQRYAGLETFRIRDDVAAALELPSDELQVALTQKSRGGTSIAATS